jgi:hypothetical protein
MSFFFAYTFNCGQRSDIIQLILIIFLLRIHSIAFTSILDHSIDSTWNHSIASGRIHSNDFDNMPVTTRSMTKRTLATNRIIDSSMVSSDSTTSLPTLMLPISSTDIPVSSLSLDLPNTPSVFETFEISEFQNIAALSTAYFE